mmetsp:Transcript_39751/g.77672  ORF Transcript_39751/g.77672 Transcript_39751/m.77672 type:complete len:92 (-) Transcript_39751:192-467(-)
MRRRPGMTSSENIIRLYDLTSDDSVLGFCQSSWTKCKQALFSRLETRRAPKYAPTVSSFSVSAENAVTENAAFLPRICPGFGDGGTAESVR